jgi:hypothetical protein
MMHRPRILQPPEHSTLRCFFVCRLRINSINVRTCGLHSAVAEYTRMWTLGSLRIFAKGQSRPRIRDAQFWDAWWNDHISRGRVRRFLFPIVESPLVECDGKYCDVVNRDDLLIAIMVKSGLRRVLCAGSGLSQEPRALAEAGFDVTALDLSPRALGMASAFEFRPDDMRWFCDLGARRTGGRLDFVVGSLLDRGVCPGPFDAIIERRTVQTFAEPHRSTALQALAERLGDHGILLSHCNDTCHFTSKRVYHASESWFRERHWTIWNGAPGFSLSGRVAWLLRSTA